MMTYLILPQGAWVVGKRNISWRWLLTLSVSRGELGFSQVNRLMTDASTSQTLVCTQTTGALDKLRLRGTIQWHLIQWQPPPPLSVVQPSPLHSSHTFASPPKKTQWACLHSLLTSASRNPFKNICLFILWVLHYSCFHAHQKRPSDSIIELGTQNHRKSIQYS